MSAARTPPPGLSPRVRGNRAGRRGAGRRRGSIPACAGEPVAGAVVMLVVGVYPRVCGGTIDSRDDVVYAAGLSPRVRGNLNRWVPWCGLCGSIPACAGEPYSVWCHAWWRGVYPRVCGGTSGHFNQGIRRQGLSPRVRGNRAYESLLMQGSQVYPRVCGGTGGSDPDPMTWRYLSPRVRGNRIRHAPEANRRRSIPACAGEPVGGHVRQEGVEVYPRVCGGTQTARESAIGTWGLSPRVRGNRCSSLRREPTARSIPACAGEPARAHGLRDAHPVYPRVCGGTWARDRAAPTAVGLSPRVRGNLLGRTVPQGVEGSIPACAGEPLCVAFMASMA